MAVESMHLSIKKTMSLAVCVLVIGGGLLQAKNKEKKMTKKSPIDTVFAQGEVNPYGKFFTGTTYLNMLNGF